MMITRLSLVLLCAVTASSCDKSDDARCAELDETITAKAAELPTRCEVDLDCLAVDIHPGLTVGATADIEDPELDALKARRVEICGEFDDDFTLWEAICERNPGFDDGDQGSPSQCNVVVAGTIDPGDVGADTADGGPDTDPGCSRHSDCASEEFLCVGGECAPLCTEACNHVGECGLLEELGLGSSIENCISRCFRVAASTGDAGVALAQCLGTAVCDDLAACF